LDVDASCSLTWTGARRRIAVAVVLTRGGFMYIHGLKACLSLLVIAAGLLLCGAAAADYPDRPIQLIVPVGPGGGTDLMARQIARKLSEAFGQPFVVENKPGGGGVIGGQTVSRSTPDGYTLLFTHDGVITATPMLYKGTAFDPGKELVPITEVAKTGHVLAINPSVPARTLPEFIALMKDKKSKGETFAFACSALGSADHLSGELFRLAADVDMLVVPYKNSQPALSDVIAGHAQFGFFSIPPIQAQVKSGKVRALAITTRTRSPLFPDLPTVAETLPGFETGAWYGIFAPAGTPPAIVEKISAAVKRIVATQEFTDYVLTSGFEGVGSSPSEFAEFIRNDTIKVQDVIRRANVHID
jgi:tripartite-type tricarboxylate transporter receptor subunit TctC